MTNKVIFFIPEIRNDTVAEGLVEFLYHCYEQGSWVIATPICSVVLVLYSFQKEERLDVVTGYFIHAHRVTQFLYLKKKTVISTSNNFSNSVSGKVLSSREKSNAGAPREFINDFLANYGYSVPTYFMI